MSTQVYPPVPPDELKKLEDETLARELQWLLKYLQESLGSLKGGLEECVALLAPKEPGSTLVLSSLRSEIVKGFVTRVGTKVVKGDVQLRLQTVHPNTPRTPGNSTPSTRFAITPSADAPELVIPQLLSVRALINDSLDNIDVSRWTGQATDASFISGQLKLLHDHLKHAKRCLKGPTPTDAHRLLPGSKWWIASAEDDLFQPRLPPNLSLHFTIQDANLVLTVRSLAPASSSQTPITPSGEQSFSLSGLNLRTRLLGLGPKLPTHDEMGIVFNWHDKAEVVVREKVRVESGDPSLMSVAAKLSALEHEVGRWRENLRTLMEEDESEDEE